MAAETPPPTCRFVREMIDILAGKQPVSPSRQDELLFGLLLDLEMDAERFGASEATCRVISRVRRLAGHTAIKGRGLPPEIA